MFKYNFQLFALSLLFLILNTNCKKAKPCYINNCTGRIIGFDPCKNYGYNGKVDGSGFVIERVLNSIKDTVVCYDLPEGLFTFQNSYFNSGYSSYLFEPNTQNLFKINFYFKDLTENEKLFFVCAPLVTTADFNAATKGKQIKTSCLFKL